MPLEYVSLFVELLEITKKITVNTIEDEQKRKLSEITDGVLNDIAYVLNYCSEQEYCMNEAKKLMILTKLGTHQKRLNTLIENLAITKICSKCRRTYLASPRFFYKDHKAKDGLRNDCKDCHKKTQKDLYRKKIKEDGQHSREEKEFSRREYENILQ